MKKYPSYRNGINANLRAQTLPCVLIGFLNILFVFKFRTQAITELELTYDMVFFKSKNSVFQIIPEVIWLHCLSFLSLPRAL